MASETSSAVLDMTDECDTSNAAASDFRDDSAPPLIMEHGYDIAVKVDAPMKQLSWLETFVTYRVRHVCARWPAPTHVRRRYNHFKVLHKRLCAAHPLLPVPPLPPLHSARQQLDRYSPGFVAARAVALDAFLSRVAKHPILTHSDDFRLFLVTPDSELEAVLKSESGPLNLWRISSALAGAAEAKTANGGRIKDPEFSSALDYLQSLEQKLTTLCTLTTKLHKDTNALAKEYNGLGVACVSWAGRERGPCVAGARGVAAGARGVAAGARGVAAGARGVAAGARGVAAGATAGGGARGRGAGGTRHHRLPLLAAYCSAVADKIRERDALHAAHIEGSASADAVHNRLEQASEALRSELLDWNLKTRAEIKELLLELAERQVSIHQQSLGAWENAHKLATETKPQDIFKTVSKHCVQNLSPSKCKSDETPTETERDFEDFDIDNDSEASDKTDNECARVSKNNISVKSVNVTSDSDSKLDVSGDVKGMHVVTSVDTRSNESISKQASSDPLSEFAEVDLSKEHM